MNQPPALQSAPAAALALEPPLVVDLDGTLIKSDLLLETFYLLIKRNVLTIFLIPFWLLKGKAYLKMKVAERTSINAASLPFQEAFLQHLQTEASAGRTLILATASFNTLARSVADHLRIFADVLATDETTNLSGKRKLAALIDRYGQHGFDYAGNSLADLHIFPHARYAILVNPERNVLKAAQRVSQVKEVFEDRRSTFLTYIKAIRAYQWLKNLLVFLPLFASHQWLNSSKVIGSVLAAVAFSFCASGGYLFNDLLDIPADRNHPRKKRRPLASGELSIISGTVLMILLTVGGLAIAATINWRFLGLLIGYSILTLAYSLRLKAVVLIDVMILASLYTLRVIAGAEAISVPLSFWLLAFSIFLFSSLALAKRCSELYTLNSIGVQSAAGRDYRTSDIAQLREMGIASGYLSIVVIALYINSPEVSLLYSHPRRLWLICLVLFYWISRIWLKTGRGEMTDDPIIFSLRDTGSRAVVITAAIILLFAI